MTHSVVVVESPAKAKTINKYLGSDYTVLSSYGHVRDLPSKNGSVDPEKNFSMLWEVSPRGKKQVKAIEEELKNADTLLLATDPDREGEAISWHILEILKKKKALTNKSVQRIIFHEITPSAIKKAIENPRDINAHLVDAYLARRALDYLVGFSLSPILWRKLPGSRSAGRVQSVALRLIAERENDIEVFKSQEYWSLHVLLQSKEKKKFEAYLSAIEGKKADKFQWKTEKEAKDVLERLKSYKEYKVSELEKKHQKRQPSAPFTTSTLQQEASRKLGFPTYKTMSVAQKLYEGVKVGTQTIGLITYMRTDNVNISSSARDNARGVIKENWGPQYICDKPRIFKSKAKNAQEAHEAIRPTNFDFSPEKASKFLDSDQLKLYILIWKRAIASQMAPAEFEQVRLKLNSFDNYATLSASGSTLLFEGFLKLYKEGKDEEEAEEGILPLLTKGQLIDKIKDRADQHFTQPPPRYTEASLVKKLEELGIGRPSTYASIIKVLMDRHYVKLDSKRFIPEGRGRVVTSFLESYFNQFIEYSFTADLENKLDDISHGELPWKSLLDKFWKSLDTHLEEAKKLKISDVLDVLTNALAPFLWPNGSKESETRLCPKCKSHKLSLKVGKFGAFLGCENYPTCDYTRQLSEIQSSKDLEKPEKEIQDLWPKDLGVSKDGGQISIRKGPYGLYIQKDLTGEKKPKRVAIPRNYSPSNLTLDQALILLSLPKKVVKDPETQEDIYMGIGRFGPYLKLDNTFFSIPKNEDILSITESRALEILEEKKKAQKTKKKKK